MALQTPNYALNIPTVGGDTDLWGGFLNANWEKIDDLLAGTGDIDGIKIVNGDIHGVTGNFDEMISLAGSVITDDISTFGAGVNFNAEVDEGIQTLGGSTPTCDPGNGGPICDWTPGNGSNTPAITLDPGEYITLMIHLGTGTITWSGITWLNGTPVLDSNETNVCEFFKVGSIIYGAFAGAT